MSIVSRALEWAMTTAADDTHGYDQAYRWGQRGDYDCSSFVTQAYHVAFSEAGLKSPKDYGANTTHNMRNTFKAAGFTEVTDNTLTAGDVILNEQNHVVMYIGGGRIVSASINERGGTHNGQPGDQTGREISVGNYYIPSYGWDCVLRYVEDGDTEMGKLPTIRHGSTGLAVRAMQELLMLRGIQLPLYGADGDWGDETQRAVLQFQKICGMEEDGICGAEVWKALTA